jgi:hypothetical protein
MCNWAPGEAISVSVTTIRQIVANRSLAIGPKEKSMYATEAPKKEKSIYHNLIFIGASITLLETSVFTPNLR